MAYVRSSRGPIGQYGHALVLPFFEISVVQCRTIAPSEAGLGRVAANRPEFVLPACLRMDRYAIRVSGRHSDPERLQVGQDVAFS